MRQDPRGHLVNQLKDAHALEQQALKLLDKGAEIIGDEQVARIFRAHRLQTAEHERLVAERLEAHGAGPSKLLDVAMQAAGVGIGLAAAAVPDTPVRLASAAYAFENLEIAAYTILRRLADRAGDADTAAVAERILEQEEAAAELVCGALDRVLDVTLGQTAERPTSSG